MHVQHWQWLPGGPVPRLQERNPAPGGLSQPRPVRDSGGSQATPPGTLPFKLLLYGTSLLTWDTGWLVSRTPSRGVVDTSVVPLWAAIRHSCKYVDPNCRLSTDWDCFSLLSPFSFYLVDFFYCSPIFFLHSVDFLRSAPKDCKINS